MGFSAKPKVYVGVTLGEVMSMERKTETYDKYDERGNKTGQTGTDTKLILSATVNGISRSVETTRLYVDTVGELLGLSDSPNKGLGLHSLHYEEESDLDNNIVGIALTEVDVNYGPTIGVVDNDLLQGAIRMVKEYCKEKYGVEVEAKIYLYANASY